MAKSVDLGHGLSADRATFANLFDRHYQDAVGYPALGYNYRVGLALRVGGEWERAVSLCGSSVEATRLPWITRVFGWRTDAIIVRLAMVRDRSKTAAEFRPK